MSKQLTNNVYKRRTEQGITQEQLAAKVSVTRQTIIAIEKGNYVPSVALAIALAHAFATTVEELFWYH